MRNIRALAVKLQTHLKTTQNESVYHSVVSDGAQPEHAFWDVMTFLLGGTESSAQAMQSALFWMRGAHLQKLRAEGSSDLSVEGLDQREYLAKFVKEILRISPPGVRSIGYSTK